ncbi:lipopolysaccharide assembly protein LapB [Kerstersia similis]|uniref:lipopolysaccharide assembly protein LapB n=1 Tax=Kerstersia similis TaxID=206505 RepID=UPI0039F0D74B
MNFEPWWLIFVPVLFGLGWVAARVDIRQMLRETRQLPDSYFRGLNFLLNEQPDRAIDAFVEVAKLDTETIELHFALGNLFRRRGEIERAIRVHQSLLSRADLPAPQREQAMYELAQDFLKSGMLDRAEEAFRQLQETRYALQALQALIRIYEAGHDWPKAIETVRMLRAMTDEPVPELAHYYCELAQMALQGKTPDLLGAQEALDAAEAALPQAAATEGGQKRGAAAAVRIAMLRAQVAARQNDAKAERLHLEAVLHEHPAYAGLVAEALLQNYRAEGKAAEGLVLLQTQYVSQPSLDLFNIVFRELRAQQSEGTAWNFARSALSRRPSLLGLDRLLEIELAENKDATKEESVAAVLGGQHEDLALLRTLIHKHTQRLDRYACNACGFQARRFYWQCPGCNAWETYPPRRLEEM